MKLLVLLKKEFNEIMRTSKIFVLPLVFLFIAVTSPLLAKYTPELVKLLTQATGQSMDLTSLIPPAKFVDSFVQLYKNLGQIGLIVLLFAFAGTMTEEKTKGTATLILTKGVSRNTFVASKFVAAAGFFTTTYILMLVCFGALALYLFPETPIATALVSVSIAWFYCLVILSIIIMASVMAKNYMMSAVTGGLTFIGLSILGSIPVIDKFTPGYLLNIGFQMFNKTYTFTDFIWPISSGAAVMIIAILLTFYSFKRQEI